MVKIFSSFDTDLDVKLLAQAEKEFGRDKVMFVRRDAIYLIIKVVTPTVLRLICTTALIIFAYAFDIDRGLAVVLQRFVWILIGVSGLWLASFGTTKLIDYYMDFTIITPKKITTYDQTGIFNRSTRALDIFKIKSISVDKKGLSRSLFNYGSIVFFSEGDAALGDIRLNYINNPYRIERKISEIMHANPILSQAALLTQNNG